VHLARLRLRDFRNYARLDARFDPGFHLLLGRNGQGKTNILEAIYLLATLRSFRGVGSAQMVRHGQKGYFVGAEIVGQGENGVRMYWSAQQRQLTLNRHPVRKLSDYLGALRAVVFCSEDVQLIKGPASRRRRFMDLLLSQTFPAYITLLQRYARALRSRNLLLKQAPPDERAIQSFTVELAGAGAEITKLRRELLPQFAPIACQAYQQISHAAEELGLEYRPSVKGDFEAELARNKSRELLYRSTLIGPHRDELLLTLQDRPALQFASEGQKRSIGMALKMAQAQYLDRRHGVPPVLLIDDVMGELDLSRRSGFIPLLFHAQEARGQVFMTATEENWPSPPGRQIERWEVKEGTLIKMDQR
jgi:DNA replication and repair protein RecF